MHADRTNRAMLILFALLLIAVGLIGALTSFGAFGVPVEHAHLFANPVGVYVGHHGVWLWPATAAAGLVVALLALRWLAALLFSTDRAGDIRLPGHHSAGRTTVLAEALTDAVTGEIRSYPGVNSATARLIGDATSPDLVIETTLEQSADLSALRHRIETNAVAHARQALDNPHLPVILNLTVNDRHTRTLT